MWKYSRCYKYEAIVAYNFFYNNLLRELYLVLSLHLHLESNQDNKTDQQPPNQYYQAQFFLSSFATGGFRQVLHLKLTTLSKLLLSPWQHLSTQWAQSIQKMEFKPTPLKCTKDGVKTNTLKTNSTWVFSS